MSEPRNFMALDWVKGEIEDTLRTAREALEAFFESPDDTTLARQCLTSLHQVNGTLQMVELHGAAALATEMEALAQALMNDSVRDNEAALESLMEGILQLPSHLDRVHRGGEDDPRVHALLMDRMRVARGEEPRARREEMAVDPDAVAAFLDSPLPVETRKLRSNYQRGMVALIRNQQPPEKLWPFLDRIFTRLEQITPGSPLKRLWDLAAGVMEIRAADGEPPSSVVPLLRGPRAVLLGALAFGIGLYVFNFQILGRLFFEWFLEGPNQLFEIFIHAVYGLLVVPFFASALKPDEQRTAASIAASARSAT